MNELSNTYIIVDSNEEAKAVRNKLASLGFQIRGNAVHGWDGATDFAVYTTDTHVDYCFKDEVPYINFLVSLNYIDQAISRMKIQLESSRGIKEAVKLNEMGYTTPEYISLSKPSAFPYDKISSITLTIEEDTMENAVAILQQLSDQGFTGFIISDNRITVYK